MRDVLCPAVAPRRRERLHKMPAGEIGAGDITDLTAARQRVQRIESLLDRRKRVEAMHVIDVDVVDAETPQARVTGPEQVMTRRADVIRTFAESKGRFGRNQEFVALALYGLAQNFLGKPIRIDVRRIDTIDPPAHPHPTPPLPPSTSPPSPA